MSQRQKDNALHLAKFIDKKIMVKLSGGREGGLLSAFVWSKDWRKSFLSLLQIIEVSVSFGGFV